MAGVKHSFSCLIADDASAQAAAPITDPRAQEALEDDEILLLTLTRILH